MQVQIALLAVFDYRMNKILSAAHVLHANHNARSAGTLSLGDPEFPGPLSASYRAACSTGRYRTVISPLPARASCGCLFSQREKTWNAGPSRILDPPSI